MSDMPDIDIIFKLKCLQNPILFPDTETVSCIENLKQTKLMDELCQAQIKLD